MEIKQMNVPDERRWQKRIRPREFSIGQARVFRIVSGPVHRWLHLWPTQTEDPTTNVMKNTWHSSYVQRDQSTILDKLAQIDIVLKQKHLKARGADPKEAGSMLAKMDRYDYAVIPRNTPGEAPSVQVFEANWSTYNAIKESAKKIDPTNPRMLLYGLCYMYDISVTKVINDKTGQFNYTVDVMPNCPTAGKIPDTYLDTEKCPIENPAQYFSAQDLELINAVAWELKDIDLPLPDEELIKTLKEFPIDLGRRDKKGAFMFFNDKDDFLALQSFATKQGLPILIPTQTDMGALPPPQNQGPGMPSNGQPVDAQFEMIPNGSGPVPAPTFSGSASALAPAAGAAHAAQSAPMAEKVAPTRTDPAPNVAVQPTSAPVAPSQQPPQTQQPQPQKPSLAQPNIW